MKLHFTYSPTLPWYLVTLRPKYLPRHPILEHPWPMYVLQLERRHYAPIQQVKL